ncbi:MAG: hypothetical protein GF392_04210, partial [Candidatus Omnitrophica bacterium]|nr:hypothetical protein [Candidatus Omnitrophota bacterium]
MDTGSSNTSNYNYNLAGNNKPSAKDGLVDPVSLIELRTNRRKRTFLKVISLLVASVFLWEQIGIADVYSHKRTSGVAEELLPSSSEYDQNNRFAPAYLKRQQQKHEDIVRQRMGKEDLMVQLKRKPKEEVEDSPLKKKKGSGGGGGSVDYTLTEPDDVNDPHNYNDLEYENNTLNQIDTYDITKYPMIDIEQWRSKAEKKVSEDTGLDYWVGYEDGQEPGMERKIKEAIYFGSSEKEKIKSILSGYVKESGTNSYKPKYRTDYNYAGEAISSTLKYLIWDDQELLIEKSIFEGGKDDNRIVKKINYDKNTGKVLSRQDFIYGSDGEKQALREVRYYDTKELDEDSDGDGVVDDSDGDGVVEDPEETGTGRLKSVTYFIGDKDKTIADRTVNYSKEGTVTSTSINYYEGGKRAEDLEDDKFGYRTPKERVVTYKGTIADGAVDADGDGLLDGYENEVTSISYYHTAHRLPGEEVLDYTERYARGKVIQSTVYFYGEDEVRASEANYRLPMSKSVTYWGDGVDEDGNIKDDAREKSVTYYYIEERLKGEETSDYTIKRNRNGDITSTTIYYYEGDKRASESEADDRMSKSVTYRGEVDTDADTGSDGFLEGYEDKIASITYYDYLNREKGGEVSDYTVKYNSRQKIVSTTIYLYEEELKRAKDAASDDRMDRSVTYRGEVDAEALDADGDGLLDGYEDRLDSITYYHYEGREKGEEVSDYTEKFNSRQEITSTTVYLYESDLRRAKDADSYDRMSRSVTYRGDMRDVDSAVDSDGDGEIDGYDTDGDGTIDIFAVDEDGNGTIDGYDTDGDGVIDYYGELMDFAVDTDGDGEIDGYDIDGDGVIDIEYTGSIASITYYDYEDRVKGEEVQDYTEKFNSKGKVTTTTVYLYESDLKRAKDAWADDRMSRSVTYRGAMEEVESAVDTDGDGVIDGYDTDGDGTIDIFAVDEDGNGTIDGYDTDGDGVIDHYGSLMDYAVDTDGDGIIDGYDLDGDGVIDIEYTGQVASITYYDYEGRLKGEEVQDYTEKFSSKGKITSTTVYLYESDLRRAKDAASDDRMSESVTYRGEVDNKDYGIDTDGDGEIDGYDTDGDGVIDFTGKLIDYAVDTDGDGIIDGFDTDEDGVIDIEYTGQVASITYYDYEGRLKGEEVQDYTEKFDSNGEVASTTVYLYESTLLRAKDAASDDRMSRSVTYRGAMEDVGSAVDTDGDGTIDGYDTDGDGTIDIFAVDEDGNGTIDGYDTDGDGVIDQYGDILTFAEDTDADGVIDGYDIDADGVIDIDYTGLLLSITYYDYEARLKGEEVTDYTEKFNSSGNITSTTVYLYESGLNRAEDAAAEDRMSESVTYRGALADPANKTLDARGVISDYTTQLASITYYDYETRIKGEEVTDYTEKYSSSGNVTNTTVYLYESDLKRASGAESDDRMSRSVSYRGQLADPFAADSDVPADGVIDIYESKLASITYYDYETRLKGEEVTDYTEKFNSDGNITTSTVYLYESSLDRAEDAGSDDRMSESVTYRGALADPANKILDARGVISDYTTQLASITYYDYETRLKGEEITDYTEKFNSAGDVTSTTVYLYESGLKRAEDAGSDDRMSESVTYRGALADPANKTLDARGVISDYTTQLASITYYDYETRLKGEEITDYTEKFNSKGKVTTTSVYLYEAGLNRAEDAGADDRMSESVTYRGALADPANKILDARGVISDYTTQLASITYYDYETRLKGEEITDYTEKFNSAGNVTSTTVYLYESALKRAEDAGSDDRMSESVTYRGALADPANKILDARGVISDYTTQLASITYYDYETRLKGEE